MNSGVFCPFISTLQSGLALSWLELLGLGQKEPMMCAELCSLELCFLKERVLNYSLKISYFVVIIIISLRSIQTWRICYSQSIKRIFENFDFAVD